MLICNECGCIFREDEARVEQDKDYVNNGLGLECVRCDDILHCPECDSEEVDEAVLCSKCGEYFYPEGYYLICPSCREEEDSTEDFEIYDEENNGNGK